MTNSPRFTSPSPALHLPTTTHPHTPMGVRAPAKAGCATLNGLVGIGDLVPMPANISGGGYGGRGYLFALCGSGVAE